MTANVAQPRVKNLGFAFPAHVLRPILDEIIENGKVARAWLRLYGQMVSPPILIMFGIPEFAWDDNQGFLEETVEPRNAAERAGLRGGYLPVNWGGFENILGGDIITEVNGLKMDTLDRVLEISGGLKPDDTVRLTYLRDGDFATSEVKFEERPLIRAEFDIYCGR